MSGARQLACAIAMAMAVTACGGDDDPDPAVDAAPDVDAEADPPDSAPARPERLLALTLNLTVFVFDADAPEAAVPLSVSGTDPNHFLRGIDRRPINGQIYVLAFDDIPADDPMLYVLDPETAQAARVGGNAVSVAGLGDLASGFDFIPTVDLIRIVNVGLENARVEPSLGANDDPNITPASVDLIGLADDGAVGATSHNVFAIDRAGSALVILGGPGGLPSANSGITSAIGPLGFTLNQTRDGGFDISPAGVAFAALADDADDLNRLYTIDTETGAATAIGLIGDGSGEIVGLTALPAP